MWRSFRSSQIRIRLLTRSASAQSLAVCSFALTSLHFWADTPGGTSFSLPLGQSLVRNIPSQRLSGCMFLLYFKCEMFQPSLSNTAGWRLRAHRGRSVVFKRGRWTKKGRRYMKISHCLSRALSLCLCLCLYLCPYTYIERVYMYI